MRNPFLLAALTLASGAVAQMPLPAFGNTYTAPQTRGFWFQAPTTFIITSINVPNEALQPFQVVEIIDLGAAPPPAFPGTVTGTQLFYNNSSPTGTPIPVGIVIPSGAYIGVLGACNSTVGATTSYNSYTSALGPFTSDILGTPTTITRFGTQFGIGAGGNNPCWQESAYQVSRVEVYVAPAAGYASSTPYGSGCISAADVSSYENFATSAAFDLSNTSISLLHTGGGYTAVGGIATYVPPSATAQVLALTDDSETTVTLSQAMPVGASSTTTTLNVCSNGFISAGGSNGVSYTPAPATFLNGARTWWSLSWHDYNPSIVGSGQVKFEQIGTTAYVTWDGVWDYTGTTAANANTMQAQFDLTTGSVHFVYQTMSLLGNGHLVGFSDAGPSADPGSMDISAALPSYTAATFARIPLAHTTSARPIIGTTINLNASQVPPGTVLGVMILGLTQLTPGVDLTFLGMPGCYLNASLDVTLSALPTGTTFSVPFSIPANNALVGFALHTQAATFTPGITPFGFVTSNGMRLVLDLL